MENQALLEKLAGKIVACQACDLYKNTTHAVPGEGSSNAKVFFIGEGPGYHEDQTGRPFVGRAGQLLEKTLEKVGLSRKEVFIGNVVKHRPPENRDPLPGEISACKPWLDQQLAIINPKVIVTLGRFSMQRYFPNTKITYIHGLAKKINGQIVIPMYHPAAALRGNTLKKAFEDDFLKNKELLLNPDSFKDTDKSEEDDADQIKLFN